MCNCPSFCCKFKNRSNAYFRALVFWLVCFGLSCLTTGTLNAQKTAVQDTINSRLKLLSELASSGNMEKAQLEAEDFRWFVRREKVIMPPKAISLLCSIYERNKDIKSAYKFFDELELDIRRERDIEKKSLALNALIKEYEHWELPEKALACQRQLSIAQDSLASLKVSAETIRWKKQIDSIQLVRKLETEARGSVFEIERNRAYTLAGIAALIFLALLASNFMTADRWRKRLEQRELEMELAQSVRTQPDYAPEPAAEPEIARQPAPPAVATPIVIEEKSAAAVTKPRTSAPLEEGMLPQKTALVIEANRQIVIYLKSLLSDNFEVETAETANEGLNMANDLLPDVIICDTQFEGRSGIDIVRHIKFSERTNHIPVILITDKSGEDARLEALQSGAESWFPRPMLDVELDEKINYLLQGRKYSQQHFARALHLYFSDSRIPMENPFLQNTLLLIEENLSNPDFMADDMSRKMQLTKHHFTKKLMVLTGKEPAQLIREMRLEKAKNLLEKRAAPVQTIAELVGFTNAGTFSLAYKEYFGENTLLLQSAKTLGTGKS